MALAGIALIPAGAAARPATVEVAVDSGSPETVSAGQRTVSVRGKRCAVPENTALAALLASGPKPALRDYGSCSPRARDASGLFVTKLAGRSNRGQDGWVYKVGTKVGTAGAADPSGPFGRGRIKRGAQILWFYCRLDATSASCQRTLHTKSQPVAGPGPKRVTVTVTACDDRGKCVAAPAGVSVNGTPVDAAGVATVEVSPGSGRVQASGAGLVSSFPEDV